MELKNALKHFKLITTHRWYVFLNCCKAGMPIRGLIHDLSKYHPVEFCESVKYFQGNRSPIDACKEANGYSKAWMHHKGRNPHHYEHWQDNFDKGGQAVQMPFEYALELVCDYLAAGKAYMKKDFTYEAEYNWWCSKKKNPIAMHPQTKKFVDMMLEQMKLDESSDCLKKPCAKYIYTVAERSTFKNSKPTSEVNINSIDEFMETLANKWKEYPELRFGQLVVSILGEDPFYMENDEAINLINNKNKKEKV